MNPATRADEICLLRLPKTIATTGFSRSVLLSRIGRGLFVRPVKIGLKCNAWPSHEVQAIVRAHVAGLSESEIASLVQRLHENRTATARANQLTTEASVA